MEKKEHKYQVKVSSQAAQMLVSHAYFLAQASPAGARRLMASFREAADSLAEMPERCPWLNGEFLPKHQYRYLLFEKRYLLVFQVIDNLVYISHVLDGRQDYAFLFRR